jgi:hypothetical protein
MALSNQSALAFFLSPAKNLIGFCKSCEMALAIEKKGLLHSSQANNSGRCLTENGQIPEDDLNRLAKVRLTPSRNWKGPGTSLTVIWCHRQVNLLNLIKGFDEMSSLKPSSEDKGFWLVVRRN